MWDQQHKDGISWIKIERERQRENVCVCVEVVVDEFCTSQNILHENRGAYNFTPKCSKLTNISSCSKHLKLETILGEKIQLILKKLIKFHFSIKNIFNDNSPKLKNLKGVNCIFVKNKIKI